MTLSPHKKLKKNSGIFRDVYLLAFPGETRIDDFFAKTILDKDYKNAVLAVSLDLHLLTDVDISLALKDPTKNNRTVRSDTFSISVNTSKIELSLQIPAPRKWTAETLAAHANETVYRPLWTRCSFARVKPV